LVTLLGWVQARQLGTFGEKLVFFFFSAGVWTQDLTFAR
jgi:hypothetical protein